MAREKGRHKKEKKILIRVNKKEKQLAEKQSRKAGENTSQYFRRLLREDALGISLTRKITNMLRRAINKGYTIRIKTRKK